MLVIINTKDRESDLILWREYKSKNLSGIPVSVYDCSEESEYQSFTESISNISLFSSTTTDIVIAHNLKYSKDIATAIKNSTNDIILVSPSGRWSAYKAESKKITTPISENKIKNDISEAITKIGFSKNHLSMPDIYNSVTVKNYSGKNVLSPILADTLLRRISAIDSEDPEKDKKLEYILSHSAKHINQWKVIDFLFSSHKKEQYTYFSELTKTVSPFELIAQIKSTLFLLRIIKDSLDSGLTSQSIASKLKKHPFYISSLVQTLQKSKMSNKKLEYLVSRFLRLEFALKSGKFEDEYFGFEVLLATI